MSSPDHPRRKSVMEVEHDRRVELQANVARALVDSNLGDLEELSHDMDAMSVYALRADHLSTWSHRLRTALSVMRGVADTSDTKAEPANASFASARDASSGVTGAHDSQNPNSGATAGGSAVMGPQTTASYASGAVHLLMDSLVHMTQADWGTCFVYQAKTEELVLACSVGKRLDKPGSLRLSATAGIESHVLTTGIAVNVAHAYAEEEFRNTQDSTSTTRTRSELVFPLMKPDTNAYSFGVLQLCNKAGGTSFFDEADEIRTAECAQFIASIIAKFPSDITNAQCFDAALLANHPPLPRAVAPPKAFALPADTRDAAGMRLVFRTARAGHVRRAEVMRDAGTLSAAPTITEALGHVSKVHDAWRNAVLLNIELEKEISRLQESVTISKRENQRLQTMANELKKQLDGASQSLEQMKLRRQSSMHQTSHA